MTDPFLYVDAHGEPGRDYRLGKAAHIEFISPGKGTVYAEFAIDETILSDIRQHTAHGEKYLPKYKASVRDAHGTLVARVEKTLYIRRKPQAQLAGAPQ